LVYRLAAVEFSRPEHWDMIEESLGGLCAKYGLDYWRENDREHRFPTELWTALGENGWLGVSIPEEYGGQGLSFLDTVFVVETACRSGGGSTLSQLFMATPVFGGETVRQHGSEGLKTALLPGIAKGEVDFCMALTEPDAGSDTFATATTARLDGDGTYVVSGQKVWITAVPEAQYVLTIARTEAAAAVDRRWKGLSLFLIDRDSPGLTHSPLEKVGTRCISSSSVYFDEVRVSADRVVGEIGMGWRHLVDTLNTERLVTAAGCLATADIALTIATEYASQRVVFGRPIGANQGIQFPLAELKMRLEAARLITYKAAWLYGQGADAAAEANAAKFLAAGMANDVCDRAIQTLGGYGLSPEYHIERLWRDVRLFRVAPVADELILSFVAQHVLGLPRSY
jgi:acyl-CoA dehydrogenase